LQEGNSVQEMTGSVLLSVASFKNLSFPKDVSMAGYLITPVLVFWT
jgi:hypothetical protein